MIARALPLFAALFGLAAAAPAAARDVAYDVDMLIDAAGPGSLGFKPGDHDRVRISYDPASAPIAPGRYRLTSLTHFVKGQWQPSMPMDAAVIDTSQRPWRIDFVASVTHGIPITLVLDGAGGTFAVLRRPDYTVLMSGRYTVADTPTP